MPSEHRKFLKHLRFRRIIIPVVIGLGAASYILFRDFDAEVFRNIHWTYLSTFWLICAVLLMAIRDLAYMYRIRLLTDWELSWTRSFQVVMLWEFASSVTPSVVGGSAIALYIVKKEGISMGRTTAVVFITALLDELFYIFMVPIIILVAGYKNLFIVGSDAFLNSSLGLIGLFMLGYLFILILTSIIVYGIFVNPRGLKWLLIKFTSLKIFRRWKKQAAQTGDEIIATSGEMRNKPFLFWVNAFGSTIISWTARFWVVNCLILAVVGDVGNQFLIYARQLLMWVILLISPTPGGSGTAEYFFPLFLGDIVGDLSEVVAVSWRLLSYYPYLFIGVLVLPAWLRRVYFGGRRRLKFRST